MLCPFVYFCECLLCLLLLKIAHPAMMMRYSNIFKLTQSLQPHALHTHTRLLHNTQPTTYTHNISHFMHSLIPSLSLHPGFPPLYRHPFLSPSTPTQSSCHINSNNNNPFLLPIATQTLLVPHQHQQQTVISSFSLPTWLTNQSLVQALARISYSPFKTTPHSPLSSGRILMRPRSLPRSWWLMELVQAPRGHVLR